MSNVVSIFKNKNAKDQADWAKYFATKDRMELLEQMVMFQQDRSAAGQLTLDLINRGIPLFKALHDAAETQELRILCGSYHRHLQYELQEIKERSGSQQS